MPIQDTDDMPSSLYLVSCVKDKSTGPLPARELYTSDWFRKARSYVDRKGQPWFILSAKHGLVHPDDLITRYDLTLKTMKKADRYEWARKVFCQLQPHLAGLDSVIFLAGEPYREFLEPDLREVGLAVSVPMKGLRIGEQLKWLKRKLEQCR